MLSAYEMQLSGEPFAQLLDYNLANFARTLRLTDQYLNPATGQYVTDPLGYALAIESYEYSKQPMNNLSFESGAGLSLMFGPVLNPGQVTGDPAASDLLRDRYQQFATETAAGGPAGANLIVSPAPANNALNAYGWPGLWPVFAEFESFDPRIQPAEGKVNSCTWGGNAGSLGYGGTASVIAGAAVIADYECDYNSLNLVNREAQVTKVLAPDALGYAAWKQGLWVLNYWQTMQDSAGDGITYINPPDLPQVGQAGNQVGGYYPDPSDPTGMARLPGKPGVYLGDIPMEGWQGLTMLEEADNKAQLLLTKLLSGDGATLTGAASIAAADTYGYASPLLYFPAAVAVAETPTAVTAAQADRLFPQPTAFALADAHSDLAGLSGLIGGFAQVYAVTDATNAQAGGQSSFLATFDGDPFPADDGIADGEATLHDRALGVLAIAIVDLDRLHFDPANQVLVDQVAVAGGSVTRGTTVTTVELAESILALRNVYRALNGTLQLYSNDTPDTQGIPGALDGIAGNGGSAATLQARVLALIQAEANFLASKLVAASGAVANGYDLAGQAADPSATQLEAETAAIRGLLDAYLATSDATYRNLAMVVYGDLQQRFWMSDVRCFRTTAGVDGLMQFTPIRFGLLTGALRQYYKLVASDPSRAAEATQLLGQVKRSYKLILNGWDDRNQDDTIQFPDECLGAGLEMGERALTGELGHPLDGADRDSDCVKQIAYVGLPAALGGELDLTRE